MPAENDLSPVAVIAWNYAVLGIRSDLPVYSVAQLVALAKSKPGDSWVIDGINEPAEEDHDLMTFYQKSGLVPGATLRVTDVASYNSTIAVDISGREVTLGIPAAENLRVVVEQPAAVAG